jgi:hypothetical protein
LVNGGSDPDIWNEGSDVRRQKGLALIELLVVIAAGCSPGGRVMTEQGFAGMWQLNREQSDIPPVTKSQTLVIETDGTVVRMRETLINDRDEALTISVDGKFDGQDYPVRGTPFADTVSYRLVTPNIIEGAAKKAGVVVVRETAVLSDDGKTVRVTYVSFDGEGNSRTSHGVFERVEAR